MTHSEPPFDPAEWAALYVAGALTPEESALFEAHVAAGDARCRAELDALGPVMEGLAAGIPRVVPSPSVRQQLLQRIAAETSQDPIGESPTAVEPAGASAAGRHGLSIAFARDARWEETGIPGITRRVLFVDHERQQSTALVRCVAGAVFPAHRHAGPEQTLLLEGDIQIGELELVPGDFQQGGAGSRHVRQSTRGGCLLLVVAPLENAR
jgi:putative transcriptional regulator